MTRFAEHEVFNLVLDKMIELKNEWGGKNMNHAPLVWAGLLTQEIGEVARAASEMHFDISDDPIHYRDELLQIAAIAISAVVEMDKVEIKKE